MPVPQNVTDAVTMAGEIIRKPWPPVWKFPIPPQADAVWDALGPLHDHIKEVGYHAIEREPGETCGSILAKAEAAILDLETLSDNADRKRCRL